VPVFPPVAAVVVLLDGRPIAAYNQAFERAGRVYVPVRPYVTALADRTWYVGDSLAIARDGRTVFIRMRPSAPDALDRAYVPLAAVARELGANVEFRSGEIDIRTAPPAAVLAPTPIPSNALAAPRVVFTPVPEPTLRPVWTGPALPRRTPLPFASPKPLGQRSDRAHVARPQTLRLRRR